jgi:uncharacterized protein
VLRLVSPDGTNKLGISRITALHGVVEELRADAESGSLKRLIITGNDKVFSAGADLNEISQLTAAQALEFSRQGQALMLAIDQFPVPVIAAIRGYCTGGGMDLTLACDCRIAAPNAVFGHRGASLGVLTALGGTQRLPRLIGKPRAMQTFLLAEMVKAEEALRTGLVNEIANDPVRSSIDAAGRKALFLMHGILIIFLARLAAGVMNAIAGRGSFISVPALIYVGIPSVSANMSSTVALYPGSITSAWAYRGNLQTILNISVKALFAATLAGGFAGAMLLLMTPSSSFDKILPWLLLLGSVAFAFGPWIGKRLQRYWWPNTVFLLAAQFLLGIYGGYFGGAVGIMMMAAWSVMGLNDLRAMNAIKVILVAAANTIAVLCFAFAGSVAWRETLVMLVAAALGRYVGARVALRLSGSQIRIGISVINFLITAAFFYIRFF